MERRDFLKAILATTAIPLVARASIDEDEIEWVTHHKDGSTTSEWLGEKGFKNKINNITIKSSTDELAKQMFEAGRIMDESPVI